MITQSKKLSAALIPLLKPTGKAYRLSDHEVTGLCLRVAPNGTKTYQLRPVINGVQIEEKLGSADILPLTKARELARKRIGQIVNDRVDPPAKISPLFEDVVAAWKESPAVKQLRPTSHDSYMSMADRLLLPAFTGKRIGEIARADIQARIEKIFFANGGRTSNVSKMVLGRIFEFAIEKGHIDVNLPKAMKPLAKKVVKERVLSEDELVTLWRDLGDATRFGQDIRDVIALALITGQRRAEVTLIEWRDVNLTKREWFIPSDKTKANRGHLVHLSDLAMEIFMRRKPKKMPTRNSDQRIFAMRVDAATLACRRMSKNDGYVGIFSPHDLRRTFATVATGVLKIPEDIVERVLNHVVGSGRAIRSYNHYSYAEEKQSALNQWSDYLLRLKVKSSAMRH